MWTSTIKRSLPALILVGGVCLFASASAHAFCAVCYTDAMGPKALAALKSGILILLIPTVLLFSGLLWLTFRHRNSYPYWPSPGSQALQGILPDSDLAALAEVREATSGPMPLPAYESNRSPASRI